MNFVDIVILIILAFGALIGFKRGMTRQLLSLIGMILVVVFAFLLKNPIAVFMYTNFPFLKFPGVLSGVSVINILLYEIIAFLFVFFLLMIIYRILVFATKVFEKFLNMTVILAIPSKLLGAVLGIIENYIIVFIVMYILTLPFFNVDIVESSKMRNTILKKTPIINKYAKSMVDAGNEFTSLIEKHKVETNAEQLNLESLDLLLKYKVTTVKSVDILIEKNKIQINNIERVLGKYR